MAKTLTKSANKKLAGVCAGVAEYFGLDATLVRLIYACLSVFTAGFPGIILYIVAMLVLPEANAAE